MIKHIVMWDIAGEGTRERQSNIDEVRARFLSLRGKVPGMRLLEVGVDTSHADHSCHVVLYTEFQSQRDLDAYAAHPAHLAVRHALGTLRVARHQVDYRPDEDLG